MLARSADTRCVHVSSSSGSDDNDGLSPTTAVATIQAAVRLLRNDHPDWLLIRRGDEFPVAIGDWVLSGRAPDEPMVVATYGPAAAGRPRFRCGSGDGLTVHTAPIHDIAFVGLHLVADAYDGSNARSYGVSLLAPCKRILLEDCHVEGFFTNLRFQGREHRDLKLRRSVVTDAFAVGDGNAQGIYVDGVRRCLIEQCVFDRNGWRPDVEKATATIFRHNIYMQGDTSGIVIRGNIIARGGSHGLQARSGGVIRDNLFLGNAINLLVGSDIQNDGSVAATVIGNVILDGRDISAAERRGWAAQFQCLDRGEIAYNVAAHRVAGTDPRSFELDSSRGVGIRDVDFHHNVSFDWGAPLLLTGNRFGALVLRDNQLQESGTSSLLSMPHDFAAGGAVSAHNRFHSTAPPETWVHCADARMSLDEWKAAVADGTSTAARIDYPRAHQTIADYDRATGGRGSLVSYVERARRQSRATWNEALVGSTAAAHFRANFGVVIR